MYHAIHKESGRVVTLEAIQVNDMFEDSAGRIVICSTEQELFWLLVDAELIHET